MYAERLKTEREHCILGAYFLRPGGKHGESATLMELSENAQD